MKRCRYCAAVLIDNKCPNQTCIAYEKAKTETETVIRKAGKQKEVRKDE